MKGKPVILVVDDRPQNIELYEAYLAPEGYEIVKATNGEEALEKLSQDRIDLILLDVRMPGMDGYEVTRRVRKDNAHRLLPIILVTILRETADRVKGIEAGCDDFISSPVDKMELLARVRSLLKVKAYNDLMSNFRKELESEVNLRTEELKLALERLQQDTTKRKLAEEALRESEAKYRLLINTASESVVVAQDGLLKFVNPVTIGLLGGYSEQELIDRPFSEFIHPDDRSMVVENYRRRIANEAVPPRYSFRVVTRDGIVKWMEINAALMEWQGKPATLNFLTDITQRKQAEQEVKMLSTAVAQSTEGIAIADLDGNLIFINEAWSRMHGYKTSKELLGKSLAIFHNKEQFETCVKPFNEKVMELGAHSGEVGHIKRDGKPFPTLMTTTLLKDEKGKPYAFAGIVKDITERKRAEESVQASLREKEILLREIHHRVKNNMQIISSLFNLQAGHIKDEDARRMLKEGQLRIRSMALVHEKLYQSRDLSKIDFADYLRSLSVHLFHFFMVEADRIRLETDLEDVYLDINSAVPCGLLVSELITNALKHAFPGDRKGVIGIRLHRREDGAVELRVADDGVGLPEAVDFRKTESLGLQIVALLAAQLEGTIELDRKKGTAITIAFRELGYKART